MSQAAAATPSSEENDEQLALAFRNLDAQDRNLVEAHAGNEVAMRPPTSRHIQLTRDQFVLRQWILRDQIKMMEDKFSHQQLTAESVMPSWKLYELKVQDKWYPARIERVNKQARYVVVSLVDGKLHQSEVSRLQLRPIQVWSPKQTQDILQHVAAGVFTDPLGVCALHQYVPKPEPKTKSKPDAGIKGDIGDDTWIQIDSDPEDSSERSKPRATSDHMREKP